MRDRRAVLILVVCLAMLIGGIVTGAGSAYQRAVFLRGQSDPAHDAALPRRLPLAGVNVELTQYDAATLNRELDRIAGAGFVWVRQTFRWDTIEATAGTYDFSHYDALVSAVSERQSLQIVAVLDGSPAWARRPEASDRLYAPPQSMGAFGRFAAAIASHYKDQIAYYQIWDEPNLNTQWGGLDPNPADYAAMLNAAYPAIHDADSTATVIAAALAPTVETGPRNLSDVLYLRALYALGAGKSFDAAAGKPYGFNTGPDDRTVSQATLDFSHIILLREEMLRHGDGAKALWGSNFGWNHLPDGWTGQGSLWGQVDAATQRLYTRGAYLRAEQEWPWIGGLILEHWRPGAPADDPIQGFAVDNVAADWFESGKFFAHGGLEIGLHDPADPRLQYTGDWRFGSLGADVQHLVPGDPPPDGSEHQLEFSFEGSSLAFQVRRDNYVAYLFVMVDGKPANRLPLDGDKPYLMLKSPDLQPHTDLIVAADGLDPGTHTVEVRVYLGYERWILSGIAVGMPPDTRRYDLIVLGGGLVALLGLIGLAITSRRLLRGVRDDSAVYTASLRAYIRRMVDVVFGLLVSLLTLVGLLLTWDNALPTIFRRDPPTLVVTVLTVGLIYFSPAFLLTLVALIALWILVYNRPAVGLALVIFWAPFFLTPFQLYIWALPMVEVSLIIALSAALVRGLVHAARGLHYRLKDVRLAPMDWAMLAFTVVATVTLVWSDQRAPAIREWRVMVIEPVLFYALFRLTRPAERDLVKLVDVFVLAGVVVSVIGLVQYFQGDSVVVAEQGARRLLSVYSSPNNAALFLGRCIPFAVAMALIAPGVVRRAIAGIAVVIMGGAVLLTQSAGALLLGLPVAISAILILWDRRRGLIATGAIGAGLFALIPLSRFIPRLQGVLDLTRASSVTRTEVWTSAVNLLRDRPITGAGLDQFLYLYRSRYILLDAWREPDLSHPHNVVLDYWISLGIVGLAVLAALQITFWRSGLAAWRRWRGANPLLLALAVGAMGSMANFLAHGLVDNSYFVVDLSFIFCFSMALVNRLETVQISYQGDLTMKVTLADVDVELVQGDITDMDCDAIVNPANSHLVLGAGVAGAIDRKGGPTIQAECDKIGHCEVGSAVITGAGNLRARHVIHAVGPRMGEGNEPAKLAGATRSSLTLADSRGLKSLAFPAISTGVFGYPMQNCAEIMLRTIIEFARTQPPSLRRIVMVLYDNRAYQVFVKELTRQLDGPKDPDAEP